MSNEKGKPVTEPIVEVSSGVALPPGKHRVIEMIIEQENFERKERRRLLRLIHNRECAEIGLISGLDFGDGDEL